MPLPRQYAIPHLCANKQQGEPAAQPLPTISMIELIIDIRSSLRRQKDVLVENTFVNGSMEYPLAKCGNLVAELSKIKAAKGNKKKTQSDLGSSPRLYSPVEETSALLPCRVKPRLYSPVESRPTRKPDHELIGQTVGVTKQISFRCRQSKDPCSQCRKVRKIWEANPRRQ